VILKEVIEKTSEHFKKKGIETARLDADLLISSALGLKRIDLYLNYEKPLSEEEVSRCRDFVKRRVQGEPVAYILGEKHFYKSSFEVGSGVLVPRPETELLVEEAIRFLSHKDRSEILDLGSGTGCIPISILLEIKNATGLAVEKSPEAFYYLKNNCIKHGLEQRLALQNADVESLELEEEFDVITANPPYISVADPEVHPDVKKHEPAMALYAGKDGSEFIRKWAEVASHYLKPDGLVLFEIGRTQGPLSRQIFSDMDFHTEVLKDYAGFDRVVRARKNK
jgi:release factor glutamine methyltransferase